MHNKLWLGLLWLFLSELVFAAVLDKTKITDISLSQDSQAVRIAIQLDALTQYKVFTLNHPDRLVVDFFNTQSRVELKQLPLLSPMSSVRSGKLSEDGLRLVFDLQKPISENHFFLAEDKRLVIDVKETNSKKENSISLAQEPKVVLPSHSAKRDIVIVIDPGHGGKDPGAIGRHGTREKDVVLAISKRLQAEVNRIPGMRAVLTRKGDYYISLRERLRLARRYKADMFVAIHADAFNNPYSMGSSVFALSLRGASSEAARWLAEKENYSELGGIKLEDKSDMLRSVLIDLSQTATISSSLQAGSSVLQELSALSRLHHPHVEQARFVVLKSPDIPSLLVETGFLSNAKEEQRLGDDYYQRRLAVALRTGIKNYFWQNPPRDTLFAAQRERRLSLNE